MFRRRFLRSVGLMTLAAGPLSFATGQEPKPQAAKDAAVLVPTPFRAFVVTDHRHRKPTVDKDPAGRSGSPPATPAKAGEGKDQDQKDKVADEADTRNRINKMHDLVTDNALNPVVAIFSRQPPMTNRALNPDLVKLAGQMNKLVNDKDFKAARLGSFIVFLTLDKEYPEAETRDPSTKEVLDFDKELRSQARVRDGEQKKDAEARLVSEPPEYRFLIPLALAAGKSDAATAWGIGENDALTVVFYREMKTIEKWSLKSLTDDDVKAITAAVEKELRTAKK